MNGAAPRLRKEKKLTLFLHLSSSLPPPLPPPLLSLQVIGADGANSRIAKEIDAGEYDYAIAFQERIRIPEDKMAYYRDLAEMYVGDDVSPDFYGWVFPKYDHVAVGESLCFFCFVLCFLVLKKVFPRARMRKQDVSFDSFSPPSHLLSPSLSLPAHLSTPPPPPPPPHTPPPPPPPPKNPSAGTGTVVNKTAIKQYQQATRDRSAVKTAGGQIIRVEAHPIPEHPRPRRVKGRVALVGDAAGYVTKCSGEGIYFAAKSGRMAAEEVVAASAGGTRMAGEGAFRTYIEKFDKKYWATYKVLDILQKVFYRSNPAREAFVEMCESSYVQKMTFDSYLYKTVVPGNPLDDVKLLVETVGSLLRGNALRQGAKSVTFDSRPVEARVNA